VVHGQALLHVVPHQLPAVLALPPVHLNQSVRKELPQKAKTDAVAGDGNNILDIELNKIPGQNSGRVFCW
jgi:hypothetical protein